MAYDKNEQRNVALKIVAAGIAGDHECKIQEELGPAVQDTPSLLTSSRNFHLPGKSDEHRVIVLPLRGPSLASGFLYEMCHNMRMSAAKAVLLGLQKMHSIGFVHRGKDTYHHLVDVVYKLTHFTDLSDRNFLWGLSESIIKCSPETAYKHMSRPQKVALPPDLRKKGELVIEVRFSDTSLMPTAYLADFGISIKSGTKVEHVRQGSPLYCAPELFHGAEPTFASDMWSYMCLFTRLYTGCNPFRGPSRLSSQASVLGPLPEEWQSSYCGPGTGDELGGEATCARRYAQRLLLYPWAQTDGGGPAASCGFPENLGTVWCLGM